MSPTVASLLCLGLWLGQKIPSAEGELFRPSIRAVPGPVVPRGAEVSFSCQGPQGSKSFQLWEDENFLLQINTTRGEAAFPFSVKGANAKGHYRCRYWQGPGWSEFSAPLRLLVTGFFCRPSFLVRPGILVAAGETVNLTCQIFLASGISKLTFFLLKAGVPDPLQFQSTEEKVANFTLPSVKAEDAGDYSCIYLVEGRRRASDPSEVLRLEVTVTPPPAMPFWPRQWLPRLSPVSENLSQHLLQKKGSTPCWPSTELQEISELEASLFGSH
ncbi:T-cell-interacting, activating receptor on myeloid cells protein 1-like isoform 1-T1 [Sarcophilus harrisii]